MNPGGQLNGWRLLVALGAVLALFWGSVSALAAYLLSGHHDRASFGLGMFATSFAVQIAIAVPDAVMTTRSAMREVREDLANRSSREILADV